MIRVLQLQSHLNDFLGFFVFSRTQEGKEEIIEHRHLTSLLGHKVHSYRNLKTTLDYIFKTEKNTSIDKIAVSPGTHAIEVCDCL